MLYLLYVHSKILLKHFDVEKPVCNELGPILHWAAGNDKRNLVRVLFSLKTPPKVNINNEKKLNPLKLAATRGFTEMVCLLIKEGKADVNYIGLFILYTISFTYNVVLVNYCERARYASCYSLYICTRAFGPWYGGKLPLTIEI